MIHYTYTPSHKLAAALWKLHEFLANRKAECPLRCAHPCHVVCSASASHPVIMLHGWWIDAKKYFDAVTISCV